MKSLQHKPKNRRLKVDKPVSVVVNMPPALKVMLEKEAKDRHMRLSGFIRKCAIEKLIQIRIEKITDDE